MTRVLILYRPRLPGQRAQAIQVVHAAHALARRGAVVTLLADRGPGEGTPEHALAGLGLTPVDGLALRIAPTRHKGAAGAWFRAQVAGWSLGEAGVVLARDLRRLVDLKRLWTRHRVVLELHGLESGRPDATPKAGQLERAALRLASHVLANCEGTAHAWREAHADSLPRSFFVAHNAVSPQRRRSEWQPDGVVRVVGSLRPFKGWEAILDAPAAGACMPIEVVGGASDELGRPIPEGVSVRAAVPYPQVPDLLARSSALILPLADNRFGRQLTSPLKLFDYLATPVPLVLPRLPTVERALASASVAAEGLFWFTPSDAASLVRALSAASASTARRPSVRSWDDRLDPLTDLFDLP